MSTRDAYAGVQNLEVMEGARRYRDFLVRAVTSTVGAADHAGRIVDFGSGTGTIARPLRDLGYHVTCIELDDSLREQLASSGFDTAPDVSGLAAESVDAVYSMNVLEHIDDHAGALAGLHRVLRTGGRLVLYVPALAMLYSAMDRKIGHVRRYRRQPLERLVTENGFTVDRCRYVDSLGVPATLAYKMFGSRAGDLSPGGVATYDRLAFPASRAIDRVTGRVIGKNLLLLGTRR